MQNEYRARAWESPPSPGRGVGSGVSGSWAWGKLDHGPGVSGYEGII